MTEKFLRNRWFEKGFGIGETRQETLYGISFSVLKGSFFIRLIWILKYSQKRRRLIE